MSEAISKCRAVVESRLAELAKEKAMLERMLGWMDVAPKKNSGERVSESLVAAVAGSNGATARKGRVSKYSEADRKLLRLLYPCNTIRNKKGLKLLDLEEFRRRRLQRLACTSDGKPAPKKARRP